MVEPECRDAELARLEFLERDRLAEDLLDRELLADARLEERGLLADDLLVELDLDVACERLFVALGARTLLFLSEKARAEGRGGSVSCTTGFSPAMGGDAS